MVGQLGYGVRLGPPCCGRGDGRPGVHVTWPCWLGATWSSWRIGPVWPYRGEAGPGLRVAKAALALVHQGVRHVAGGLVAFRPDLVFMAESGHPPVARGLDWLSG